ncbi:hypothetical protein FRC98_20020 [Lujinxingia vulgaris]|uniref:Right handed beta helix domain-containing protein n=1 Tax=Lujinxingia vulgaris TaxID=2600176 RepID=A0A5C6X9F1_9DELT|nr:hypothetical protein [Lujinxingia vulgaris]TXD33892.1 hypothetical protein FRC98_20020 [Lujinxingia vulgaris]
MLMTRTLLAMSLIATLAIGCGGDDTTPTNEPDAWDVDEDTGPDAEDPDAEDPDVDPDAEDPDVDPDPEFGTLSVTLEGLPEGSTWPELTLSGDEGDITVGEDGLVEDLAVGDYTLSAAPFTIELASYEAAPVDVSIEADQTTEVTLAFALIRASLEVVIEGLPEGVNAQVEVAGDEGTESLTETTTLNELTPGTYSILPDRVSDGDLQYQAETATLELASGDAESVTVSYALVTGQIEVVVEGLPAGVDPDLILTNPEGIEASITQAGTLTDQMPGSYSVVANDVTSDPAIYRAEGASIEVESDQTATLTITYAAVAGELQISATGLPSGSDLEATLIGPAPASTALTITGAQTLDSLAPGDYILNFAQVSVGTTTYAPDPASVNKTVFSEQSADASTSYSAPTGTLTLTHALPDSGALTVTVADGLGFSQNITLSGTGTADIELPAGSYELTQASNGLGTDEFGNPYYVLGLDVGFSVTSDAEVSTSLLAPAPTEVLRGDDQGRGSLREVLNRVVAGSVITFADGLSEVTTESLIFIGKEVSIVGPGPDQLTLTTTGGDRLFSFDPLADVHLEGMRIADISANIEGAAIYNLGVFSLSDMVFDNNQAVEADGGAISIAETTGPIVIEDSIFTNNSGNYGGAIEIASGVASVLLERVRFENNSANSSGGAIDSFATNLDIYDAIFRNNSANASGGALHIPLNNAASLRVERALFEGNSAQNNAGAIYAGADAEILNVTFTGNTASTGRGGAYYQHDGEGTLSFVSFADNAGTQGSALASYCDSGTPLTLKNSIVVGSGTLFNCASSTRLIASLGHNYIQTESADFVADTTDTVGTTAAPLANPLLPLANNGGFSDTMAVSLFYLDDVSESATLCTDAAGNTILDDQRGETRPTGGLCTAGAFQIPDDASSFEPFLGHGLGASTYVDTTFTTTAGFTWEVIGVRSEGSYGIAGQGLMFREIGNYVRSVGLSGGVDFVQVDYRKAWAGDAPRQIAIAVNGTVVATSPVFGGFSGTDDSVFTLTATGLNISGDYTIEIRNLTPANGQVVIDNLSWR